MGPEHVGSAALLTILAVPQVTSLSQYTSALILVATARHRVLAYIVLGEGIANLALSVFLVQSMGVAGVAWGTAIPHIAATAVILPLYTLRTLGLGVWPYFRAAFVRPLLCGVPVAALCYVLAGRFPAVSWPFFALEGISVAGLYLLLIHLSGISLLPALREAEA
jgi:O-antigen/teichoic acid export membrane protein